MQITVCCDDESLRPEALIGLRGFLFLRVTAVCLSGLNREPLPGVTI